MNAGYHLTSSAKVIASSILELLFRIFIVLTFIFLVLRVLPFDPALSIAGLSADAQTVDRIRLHLLLDRPLLEQYWAFLTNIARLDFGNSYVFGDSVSSRLARPLQVTISLALIAITINIAFAEFLISITIPNGITSRMQRVLEALGLLLTSVPTFVLGVGFLLIFSMGLNIFPSTGIPENGVFRLLYLLIPGVLIALPGMVGMSRVIVSHAEELRESEWFLSLRTLGLSAKRGWPLYRYAQTNLRNVVVSYTSNLLIYSFNGAIIVELVFSIPGAGQQLRRALLRGDYPMVEGIVLSAVVVFTVVNWLTETFAPTTEKPS